MTAVVLLALRASDDGQPAALLDHDGVPTIARLLAQLDAQDADPARIVVVTRPAWLEAVAAAVSGVEVRGVDRTAALRLAAGHDPDEALVVLDGHVVADEVALGRLVDVGARGTAAALVADGARADGVPVRVTRGRVVAAGSDHHRLAHGSHRAPGGLRVAAADRARLADLVERLVALDLPQVPAGEDLVALLLVGLVRDGVPVTATVLPAGSVWRRVDTRAELVDAHAQQAAVDPERVRLDAAVKSDDGFFTTFLVSSYSRYVARWAARRGLHPDQVTVASLLVGLVAAAAFALGTLPGMVAGAVLLQVAFMLDCVDGQLARYTRRFTVRGAWLDSVSDRAKEYAVLAGLALGGVRTDGDETVWLLAGAALALQTFRHVLDLGYAEQQRADVARAVVRPLEDLDDVASFWERVPLATPARVEPPIVVRTSTPASACVDAGSSLARSAVATLRRAEDVPVLKWAKRIVVLPIGERFALISLVAVFGSPRAVFVALLAWGGLATAYTLGGRLIRSVA